MINHCLLSQFLFKQLCQSQWDVMKKAHQMNRGEGCITSPNREIVFVLSSLPQWIFVQFDVTLFEYKLQVHVYPVAFRWPWRINH